MLSAVEKVRFNAKVTKSVDGCWIWTGAKCSSGYGSFGIGGRIGASHRIAWEEINGPIPQGLTIDHLCFVPSCVNPAHMRLLTNEQNARNQKSTFAEFCINGHEYSPANTYLRPLRYRMGRRDCRACIRLRVAKYKARKLAS